VDVTRVQPVIHTNVVTRIHDRPVITSKTVNLSETKMLPTRVINTGKTVYINEGRYNEGRSFKRMGSASSYK
jgi:hypothetical protein